MADHDITTLLHEQPNGVLSLARNDDAYGVPMSYYYDENEARIIMDFGYGEESRKRQFATETNEACLTVYDWNDPNDWRSVVVRGTLSPIEATDFDAELQTWYKEMATDISVAGPPTDLEWHELSIEELTGVAVFE